MNERILKFAQVFVTVNSTLKVIAVMPVLSDALLALVTLDKRGEGSVGLRFKLD